MSCGSWGENKSTVLTRPWHCPSGRGSGTSTAAARSVLCNGGVSELGSKLTLAVYETVVEDAIFAVLEGFQLGRFG